MASKIQVTRKTLLNVLFYGLLLTFLLVPSAKAIMLRCLMEIGLFKPSDPEMTYQASFQPTSILFKDIHGRTHSLADLEGKVVFINFWATWCPPCLAEMPSIHRLYKRFENDPKVVFLLVDADGDLKKSKTYMDKKAYSMPLYEMGSAIPEALFKGSLPTTLVFDKKGRLSFQGEGVANYASPKFVTFIEALIKQTQ